MENYEKKYKEALERAKYALTTDMDNSGHWVAKHIFPELKESEDERTRKQILNYFMAQKVNEPQPVRHIALPTSIVVGLLGSTRRVMGKVVTASQFMLE